MEQPTTRTTSDFGFAAYVILKGGLPLSSARRTRDGRPLFAFVDSDGVWPSLGVSYHESDERKYDDQIRSLKHLVTRSPFAGDEGERV